MNLATFVRYFVHDDDRRISGLSLKGFAARSLALLTLATVAVTFLAGPALADKRVALVIGNAAYERVARLSNPVNDATAMESTLKRVGFDLVESGHDLNAVEMRRALREFADKARDSDVAVIYFAGHGVEVDGTNYLIPIDATLERDTDVYDEAFSLDRVLMTIEPARRLRLIILDACRENPFSRTMKRTIGSREITRGLARTEPARPNTLIAYAAKAGSIAVDGSGKNSPYTEALIKHVVTPGLDLRKAFGFVRDDVLAKTSNRQEPFLFGSLGGEDVSLVPAEPATAAKPSANSQIDISRAYDLALQLGTKDGWNAFLAHYSEGFYADLAKAQLGKVASNEGSMTSQKPTAAAPGKPLLSAAEKLADTSQGALEKSQPVTIESRSFDTNPAPGVLPVTLTAKLYMPQSSRPVAAMVIICSSGGVLDFNEGYYARELSKKGIAALVVDSFTPRGMHDVITNQFAVTSWHMENDAFAALSELQKDKRVDPARIGVMGISKGGIVAQNSAFLVRRTLRGTGVREFALHVPIVPDCAGQFRDARTTGKPIFYMLAQLDDADPAQLCLDYVRRINVAGNLNATAKVYEGAHHNWENTRPLSYASDAIVGSKCMSLIEENGDRTFTNGNVFVKEKDVAAWMSQNCFTRGEHVGGGTEELKQQRTNDLLVFLSASNFFTGSSSGLPIRNDGEAKPAASSAAISAIAAPVASANLSPNKVTEGAGRNGFGAAAAQLIAAKASDLAVRLPPFGFGEIKGDVPPAIRRFVGAWASRMGFEGRGRQAMLLVTDVASDGTFLGYVIIGPPTKFSSSQTPAWYDDFAGRMSDGTLQFEARKSPFRAKFSGKGSIILQAIDHGNGKKPQTVSIVLNPIWQPNNSVATSKN